ncbi:Type III restriction-modification system methylation subunit [hydrothermal vent metagenome]|uniref:Type III restriction-modification system methylation subunit n=1 Tax=hydrothermal vent metagenome TaxID=652676 RepID=A0A3B0VUQ0_9ZZZZ
MTTNIKAYLKYLDQEKIQPIVSEIAKERIRRAGKKILEDNKEKEGIENLDIGFRVYKTDSTNMKKVYYHPETLVQQNLDFLTSNIKEDRTPNDLLTQAILDLGLELNLPIEKKSIGNNIIYIVQSYTRGTSVGTSVDTHCICKNLCPHQQTYMVQSPITDIKIPSITSIPSW